MLRRSYKPLQNVAKDRSPRQRCGVVCPLPLTGGTSRYRLLHVTKRGQVCRNLSARERFCVPAAFGSFAEDVSELSRKS